MTIIWLNLVALTRLDSNLGINIRHNLLFNYFLFDNFLFNYFRLKYFLFGYLWLVNNFVFEFFSIKWQNV